ncbi:ParB/RepB/Spo0J family partition protein [Streptomyces mirabilis]|uniref:ParB/RepB/Spo0J family partition protein n=1 Tax=Streptomyces mirabilis TaxID=68239 RepID=A0ABU3V6A3_9ACTN|nr:ParB/RepB/Spo0J family partition protein [Streptomyces mirabilis]MDU9001692.1 ParB/RepB/Spo0J family partition protein [Streptomyces mirabilis]
MRNTSNRDGQQRVTRGFNIEEAPEDGGQETPRRIRTRAQIMKGEGKRPPAKVELALLAHNPFNPREELTNLEETADSLRAKGQIQPVTVARRAAFLTAHPGQDDALGEAEYVVIDGNRRLASAHLAGLEELRIDVNDDLAASAADILESALIANIHREDVAPLDQAKAIQELVKVHGSQGQVAKRLGKTPAWVSQRLALLELTPDLQEKVETGELKVEPARRIGRLPKGQQAAEAQKTINAVKPPRQRRGKPAETGSNTPTVNAVNTLEDSAEAGSDTPATVNAVNTPAGLPAPAALADAEADRSEQGEGGQPKRLPYDDAAFCVHHLHRKMTSAGFVLGARVWMAVLRDQHPEEYRELLLELSQHEQQLA